METRFFKNAKDRISNYYMIYVLHNSIQNMINNAFVCMNMYDVNVYFSEVNKKYFIIEILYDCDGQIYDHRITSDKDLKKLKEFFNKKYFFYLPNLKKEVDRKKLELENAQKFLEDPINFLQDMEIMKLFN